MRSLIACTLLFLSLAALAQDKGLSAKTITIEPYRNLNDITNWDYFKTNALYQYRIVFDEKKSCMKGVTLFNGADTKSITVYFKKPMIKEALGYLKDRKKSIFYDRKLMHRKIRYIRLEEK